MAKAIPNPYRKRPVINTNSICIALDDIILSSLELSEGDDEVVVAIVIAIVNIYPEINSKLAPII
jgi:uncharacterized membrane-anchored protein